MTLKNITAALLLGALCLAGVHMEGVDEQRANDAAYLASTLEAAEAIRSTTDTPARQSETIFRPGETVTVEQQAALSSRDEAQVFEEVRLRERMEGAGFADIVLGQNVTEFKQGVRRITNTINAGGTIRTVVHEYGHGFLIDALATGRMSLAEVTEAIRAFDTVLRGKRERRGRARQDDPRAPGQQLNFLPEGEVNFTAVSEAVSEFLESEILRGGKTAGRLGLSPAIISRNIAAASKLAPGAVKKFARFMSTVRELFGLAFQRAHATRKAIRNGEISESQIDDFVSKLIGLEADGRDGARTTSQQTTRIHSDPAMAFSLGENSDANYDSKDERREGDHHREDRGGPRNPAGADRLSGSRVAPSEGDIRAKIARAKARGSLQTLGEFGESAVDSLGEDGVLKFPLPDGYVVFDRSDGWKASRSIEAAHDKILLIRELGGLLSRVIEEPDGTFFIWQEWGDPISAEEYLEIELPGGIAPNPMATYVVEAGSNYYIVRDLKPENFRKDSNGDIRISDLSCGEIDPPATKEGGALSFSLGSAKMAEVAENLAGSKRDQLRSFSPAEGDLDGGKLERAVDETSNSLLLKDVAGSTKDGSPRDGGISFSTSPRRPGMPESPEENQNTEDLSSSDEEPAETSEKTTRTLNGYHYVLDRFQRVLKCTGKLRLEPAQKRDKKAQGEAGGPDREPKDQGGHIIAKRSEDRPMRSITSHRTGTSTTVPTRHWRTVGQRP